MSDELGKSLVISSFNIASIINGDATNNITNILYNILIATNSTNINQHNSTIIGNHEVQKEMNSNYSVFIEYPNILKLIWKYLSKEDKLNCTRVCKSFNNKVSDMNCFRLIARLPVKFGDVPRLSRHYDTVIYRRNKWNKIMQPNCSTMNPLDDNVIEQTFSNPLYNPKTLGNLVQVFPNFADTILDMNLSTNNEIELCVENVPGLQHLKDLKMNVSSDLLNNSLKLFGTRLNF